jgi:hypothetical protein
MFDLSIVAAEIAAGEGLYLAKAARVLPRSRLEQPVNPSTLSRWITRGVRLADGRRVHLEAGRIAGRWVTTPGAIQRFIERQIPVQAEQPLPARTPTKRDRDQAAAAAMLARKYKI